MGQYLTIHPSEANLELDVPTSKSHSNRLLILAALSSTPMTLVNLSGSSDVRNLTQCLQQIGVTIKHEGSITTVYGPFPKCEIPSESAVELCTGDGGTTNRFLLPLLALGKNSYRLIPSEKMRQRPNRPLISALEILGAKIHEGQATDHHWLEIKGSGALKGKCVIDCTQSTQFASGILLATSTSDVLIEEVGVQSSKAYLQITKDLIASWKSGQRHFIIPVDFSSLSYPVALALVRGKVHIANCYEIDWQQADSKLFELLDHWNITYQLDHMGLYLQSAPIPAFEVDCSSCPDLTPTLSYLAAFSQGTCRLRGLEILRHKESDRLAEICRLLETFGVLFSLDESNYCLDVVGDAMRSWKFCRYCPPADHRMVMVGHLFMRSLSGGELGMTQHVAKSFPEYFNFMGTDRAI